MRETTEELEILEDMRVYDLYGPGWKMLQLRIKDKPQDLVQWARMLWGFDLWFGSLPVIKTVFLLSILAIIL